MSNAHAVQMALTHHEYLREQLRFAFPEADEDTLADTLEGESNLDQLLIAVMRSADEDEILVAGIKARVEELNERKKRIERRIEAKEAIVLSAMERANLKKIEAPDFTVSTRAVPGKVVITDETLIPAEFMRTPEPPAPVPDKKAIGDALKANTEVPGCLLSNGGAGLSVRRK
jgi:hypothetical protein